jgi:hypothetical protein
MEERCFVCGKEAEVKRGGWGNAFRLYQREVVHGKARFVSFGAIHPTCVPPRGLSVWENLRG